jgi:hypothetical protein
MATATSVIVEIDNDGVRAVYADDPTIRVVIVDHSWDDEILVSCPFPAPAPLRSCEAEIGQAAEAVMLDSSHPRSIEKRER